MVKTKKTTLKDRLKQHLIKYDKIKKIEKTASKIQEAAKAKKHIQKHNNIQLYSAQDKILLIGEGNFSFAKSLAEKLGTGKNILATCLDSEKDLFTKYEDCQDIISRFKELGGTVMFSIDCAKLLKTKAIKSQKFTKIVFNFPHAGAGIADKDRNVRINQDLLLSFFNEASDLLTNDNTPKKLTKKKKNLQKNLKKRSKHYEESDSEAETEVKIYENPDLLEFNDAGDDFGLEDTLPQATQINTNVDGEIHVTLKSGEPYDSWNIRSIAKKSGKIAIKTTVKFDVTEYPGYEHRRTIGFKAGLSVGENSEV
ncbi:25S rRNA [Smittium culicis]|uniref:25S rRNA n=1 Tax=Smittium culicis TaxID=133412 RepID=A0A1R1XMG9_9FUNG|nr:25S rRNA [Smittium culicis]